MSDVPGMSEGIEALRIMFQGVEMLFRTTGSFAKWNMDKLTSFGSFMIRLHKTKKDELKVGEIQFSDLLKAGEVGIMQIDYDEMDNFIDYATKSGLTYSIMPDLNNDDDAFEVAFLERQGSAARFFIAQNPDTARSYTFVEYQKNASSEEIERTLERFDDEVKVEAKEVKEYNYSDVMKSNGISLEMDSSFFVFDDLMEHDKIKVGIPNQADRYIEIPKKRLMRSDVGSSVIMIAMLPGEEFDVVDKKGNLCNDLSLDVAQDKTLLSSKITAEDFKRRLKNIKINKKNPDMSKVTIINRTKDGQVQSLTKNIRNTGKNVVKKAQPKIKAGR